MGIKMLHTKFLQEIPMLENHMGECKVDTSITLKLIWRKLVKLCTLLKWQRVGSV